MRKGNKMEHQLEPPPTPTWERKLLKISEVADRLNVSVKTVRRLINDGKLTYCRIATAIRIDEKDLDAYIERSKKGESA